MIKQQIKCPMCGGKARLEEYDNEINSIVFRYLCRVEKKIKFRMISYVCGTCTNSFTTTESDTIVVNRLKVAMRCEQRKSKIKKYVS
jgi:hypothetical protein